MSPERPSYLPNFVLSDATMPARRETLRICHHTMLAGFQGCFAENKFPKYFPAAATACAACPRKQPSAGALP